MNTACRVVAMFLGTAISSAIPAQGRDLTFQDRVRAQEAIERVEYSHQIGATRPFEEAVPRSVAEAKVRTYLKQSLALERLFNAPITQMALQEEMERVARSTRMPERLEELYSVLENDPLLIQESVIRPALTDRLARALFASDPVIQTEARQKAQKLRDMLLRGQIDPFMERADRTVVTVVRDSGQELAGASGFNAAPGSRRKDSDFYREIPADEFDRITAGIDEANATIGALVETQDGFLLRVVLDRGPDLLRLAEFEVKKRDWSAWWGGIASQLDERDVKTVASRNAIIPATIGPTCSAYDSWTPIPVGANSPTPRESHVAVWTGTKMIVWGGAVWSGDLFSLVNTGGRYDPVLDAWSPTSLVNAPTARWLHTGMWTGDRMVVWGGEAAPYEDATNTGGRYDPLTDTWTATSTAGAPSARWGHTSVWTGSRVVVWGGARDPSGSSGGSYDPLNDTWVPTSMVNAPGDRYFHTAVWTGSQMIVWGGESSTVLADGGRYDPIGDTWSPTSLVGAPSARSRHSAAWRGDRMIVWGATPDSSGGRYDPLTDTWAQTSTLSAPSFRWSHSAVWTGQNMVVWGGGTGTHSSFVTAFNTGGRYDPLADTWTPTSMTSVPSKRWNHTALMAGDLMLVWGGGSGFDLSDGGAYCACVTSTYYQDLDSDGFGDPGVTVQACAPPPGFVANGSDCNDADATAWGAPTEVRDLMSFDNDTLAWTSPSDPGGTTVLYDVIRSGDPANFDAEGTCAASDSALTTATDPSTPILGLCFYYQVRAQTNCPGGGQGSLGTTSDGIPRTGRLCP